MPAHITPHQPYDLSTEHGRAQSFAYSAHGAMLAHSVEICLQAQTENLCEKVEALVEKELERLGVIERRSRTLHMDFSIFLSELGKRDAVEFRELLTAYGEERQILDGNIKILQELVKQLEKLIGVENGE